MWFLNIFRNLYKVMPIQPFQFSYLFISVEGRTRVIRGCGYIRDPHDDLKCYKRTGTAGVEINYCSCTKSLCNLANSINVTVQSAVILAILITLNK